MGYGTPKLDLQQVGGANDRGIDGVISLDKLGLEKVYVQAKRYTSNTVGPADVREFYGALADHGANKGVLFFTTSRYTREAREYAALVKHIVLIDGDRLADLMIDHGIGV